MSNDSTDVEISLGFRKRESMLESLSCFRRSRRLLVVMINRPNNPDSWNLRVSIQICNVNVNILSRPFMIVIKLVCESGFWSLWNKLRQFCDCYLNLGCHERCQQYE